jgi:hypothetical protein
VSDFVPIRLHLMHADNFGNWYCLEVELSLKNAILPTSISTNFNDFKRNQKMRRPDSERHVEAVSRGGFFSYAFGELIKISGFDEIGFLGDLSYTHQISVDYGDQQGSEIVRLTVIHPRECERIASTVKRFIQWCTINDEITSKYFYLEDGNDLNGSDFESTRDAIEKTVYSLHPNHDFGHGDSEQSALTSVAFSFLKTFIYLLSLAQRPDSTDLIVCEQWGGFEPGN